MRYGIGALLFLPLVLRRGMPLGRAQPIDLVTIPLFGGILFIVLLSAGLRIAPVADSGVFTPSMLPVYTAVLSFAFLGERFSRARILGFVLIVAGALAVGGWAALNDGAEGIWRGHLLFTLASICWAIYTIAFRRSGLDPITGGALMCFWAGLFFAVAAVFTGVGFSSQTIGTLAVQVFFQGVLTGFVATFTFFYAIQHYGASRTAAFAALVPVLAALGGWAFLGEPIGLVKAAGILVVVVGVVLASGAFTARRPG